MYKKQNKYVAVAYKLYAISDGNTEMVEEATADKPFQFITGFGITLDEFENQVYDIEKGGAFDFHLTCEQAYGQHEQDRVLALEKSVFSINGHFDHDNIYKDAVVPLQNEDGNRFLGLVLDVTDDNVVIDLNHPLAGCELNFKGTVIENREATNAEIEGMLNRMSEEAGGCCCHHDHNHDGEHECCGGHGHGECGHHHHDGNHECCGGHGHGECGHHHHDGECCGGHHH